MSRWSRKTDEEKQRIYEEQVTAKQEKQHDNNAIERGQQRAVEIYDNQEIPIFCVEHGWVASDRYCLNIRKNPLTGQNTQYIEGNCQKCKAPIQRVCSVSVFSPAEAMMFSMVIKILFDDGRLRDERPR